ncbi:MAG: hypothetical protein IJK64_04455 [Clostridia bacterium]|nr:hypothetical protein [Clostridia bacterium]
MNAIVYAILPAEKTALTACVRALLARVAQTPQLTVTCAADAAAFRLLEAEEPALFAQMRAACLAGRLSPALAVSPPAETGAAFAAFAAQMRAEQTCFETTLGQGCEAAVLLPGCRPALLPQLLVMSGLRFCILPGTAAFAAPAPLFWWESADGARVLAACEGAAVQPLNEASETAMAAGAWFRAQCTQPLDLPTLREDAPAQPLQGLPLPEGFRMNGDGVELLDAVSDGAGCRLFLAETAGREVAASVLSDAPQFGFYADFLPYALKVFEIDQDGFVTDTDFYAPPCAPEGEDA